MSLRSKLSRLTSSARAGASAREADVPPHDAEQTPGSEPSRSAVLDGLRERIRATLERSARRAPTAPQVLDAPELPFATSETPLGPLHVRTLRLSPAHRTGRAQVRLARHADPEVLSLLALDPRLAPCDPSRALYLDTETTGLSGGTGTIAFLVGLAWWDLDGDAPALVLEQILVRALGEEAPMLARVRERIEAAAMLVTFNGKSFDLPLLRTRFVMARAQAPAEPPHLDLLHVARRVHKQRTPREGCRLVALERDVLGFERSDDVESRDVSECYLHFLRTGDTRGLLSVVEHNAWDVVAMAALVGVYGAPACEGHDNLAPEDLVGVARTMRRAGALDRALAAADAAVDRALSPESLRARAEIAKARGERDRALADFEAITAMADDPAARLELAKICEHTFKSAAEALAWAQKGTGEAPERARKRVERLTQKVEKGRAESVRRPVARRPGGSRSRGGQRVVQDLQGVLDVALGDDERRRDP